MNTSGFFQEANGNSSNTRLLVAMLIIYGIAGSGCILGFGLYKYAQTGSTETLMAVATAAGAFVSSIAAVAGGWKIMQKGQEEKPSEGVK